MKIEMTHTKSTKGTRVYTDAADKAPVPTLYIKKAALSDPPPKTITVIIGVE